MPIFSGATNRQIFDEGVQRAVDEACLPVKVFYGHVAALDRMNLDYLFLPNYTSVEPRAYICPKSMGLPFMIKAEMDLKTPVIDPLVDLSRGEPAIRKELNFWGKKLQIGRLKLQQAWKNSINEQKKVNKIAYQEKLTIPEAIKLWEKGDRPEIRTASELTIGLLGHGYINYDPQINLDLLNLLQRLGVRVMMPEMIEPRLIKQHGASIPKRVFWSIGYRLSGAALAMQEEKMVDGIIYTSCFGCGPYSIVGELIQHRIKQIPLLTLTLDEHTGQAGLQTRLEAFVDLLERKKKHAG